MSLANARDIIKERLITRGLEYCENGEFTLTLTLDKSYRYDTYAILGKDHDVEIKADCLSNILGGTGAFLYSSRFDENGIIPSKKRGKTTPDCKAVIAAWTFDTPEQGEWQGLFDSLKEDKWADMILADSHTDFPRFPLDKGVPGDLPLMAFPEISMWGLFPWGAYGAVAYPRRYTGIWRQTEGKLSGELLYSEGIYEDLNKYTVANLSKSFEYDVDTTLSDYAGYELGLTDTDKFIRLIDCIETNHYRCASKPKAVNDKQDRSKWVKDPPLLDVADEALALAKEIDASLPEWGKRAWRWRIIYIRALLDSHRYRGEELSDIPECLEAMHELIDLYHCLKSDVASDPYHHRVRPECPEY